MKTEVAQIAQTVAQNVFARTNLYWTVEREVHARLPGIVTQHANAMLPGFASQAVAAAAPNPLRAQAAVEEAVRDKVAERLPAMLRQAANEAVVELAAEAVRAATPDADTVRAQLTGAATAEVERAAAEALPQLLRGVREQADAAVTDTVTQESLRLLPELAGEAVAAATPDRDALRAELTAAVRDDAVRGVSEWLHGTVTEVVNQATTAAAGEMAEQVAREVQRVLPELAGEAVAAATPDRDALRVELAAGVRDDAVRGVSEWLHGTVTEVVNQATTAAAGEMAEQVAREVQRVLPELAGVAIAAATPDRETLRAEMSAAVRDDAVRGVSEWLSSAVTKVVNQATEAAAGELAERVATDARADVRGAVREEAERAFATYAPNVVSVVLPQGGPVELGADTHAALPELLVALHARCHVLLVGQPGTGKSTLAKHAAAALRVPLQALSLGPTTPMSKVFGYYDAHGTYHDTPFRRAFEHGELMLVDDLDNGHPGLLAELNQALALGTCAFADGMVDAHPDFRMVATGNTYGTGGDRQYAGRQSLDAATLDRFVVIDVPVDEALEQRLALRHAPSHPDEVAALLAKVRTLRALAEEKNLPVVFSPRASIDGAKLLEAGADVERVLRWRVVRGLSEAHRAALDLDT